MYVLWALQTQHGYCSVEVETQLSAEVAAGRTFACGGGTQQELRRDGIIRDVLKVFDV